MCDENFLTSDAQVLVTRPPNQTANQAEERFSKTREERGDDRSHQAKTAKGY